MPNWVTNTIAVKGSKNDVYAFIKVINAEIADDDFDSVIPKIEEKKPRLSTFVPMPQTFIDYDTTNHRNGVGLWYPMLESSGIMDKYQIKGNISLLHGKLKEVNSVLVSISNEVTDDYLRKETDVVMNIVSPQNEEDKTEFYNDVYNYLCNLKNSIPDYTTATKEQEEKYGCVGWYEWGLKNWGVKWDAKLTNFELVECDDEFILYFRTETAWSIPDLWLYSLLNQFPNLRFAVRTYEEQPAWNGYFNLNEDKWIENFEGADWENEEEVWDMFEELDMRFYDYVLETL